MTCGQEGAPAVKRLHRCKPCHREWSRADKKRKLLAFNAAPRPTVTCPKCGLVGPQYRFGTIKCRDCYTARTRERYADGISRIDAEGITIQCHKCGETKPQYAPGNQVCGDCERARIRQWEKDNRSRIKKVRQVRYWQVPEQYRGYGRKWQINNRDIKRAAGRAAYWLDVDATRAYRARYRESNRSAISAYSRAWCKRNPEVGANGAARRRARERNLSPIPRGWKATQMERQGGKCAGCFKRFTLKRKATIDHLLALASGGDNHIDNLQLLCWSCNSSKQDMPETEWRRRFRGQLL